MNSFSHIGQSEEHLVVETTNNYGYNVGDEAYVVPVNICPTVAKYNKVLTVVDGKITVSGKLQQEIINNHLI